MNDDKRLVFHIDAYSPETIPMATLADYLADFAALLGRDNAVHFVGLEPGSTKIAARVGFEDVPKVTTRLHDIRLGNPPKDADSLFKKIDAKLANDNAVGRILVEDDEGALAELLAFPGRNRPKAQSYGPLTQEGHLDGRLISVGGRDETISIRLQNGDVVYTRCETSRAIARGMAKHFLEPIRIHGSGRWIREADGAWTLIRFRISRFEVLENANLRDAVSELRNVRGNGWKNLADPVAELDGLRAGAGELL